ncbi:MAG: VOC family protein, partial [Nitrospiraceae bacterium]
HQYVFLGDGHMLSLTLWPQSEGRFETRRPGLHHLSFQVDTIEQVREAERHLRALNVRFHYEGIVSQADELEKTAVYFEDPDGIRLEIYSPTGVEKGPAPVPGAPSCGFF